MKTQTSRVGYLMKAFDTTWKPVESKEQFMQLLTLPEVSNTIALIRQPSTTKSQRQNLKKRLPAFFFMGMTPDGKEGPRKKDNLVDTHRVMLDFDTDEGDATQIYNLFLQKCPDWHHRLLLAHRTPSGHGLRLVLTQPAGMTIEQIQAHISQAMQTPLDTACKDRSRLSYACTPDDIIHLSDQLFAPADTTPLDATPLDTTPQAPADNTTTGYTTEEQAEMQASIVEALTELMGGAPAHGSRNQFIFSMACQLRHICNDNPDWIMQIIPTFGEDPAKVRSTVVSACNRAQVSTMPQLMRKAIAMAKGNHDADPANTFATMPQMPREMPEMISHITQNVPDFIVPSCSQAVFPALGALLTGVCYRYIDNTLLETSLMHVQVGKTATGKGYINQPVDSISQDIELDDAMGRAAEEQWRQECSQRGANAPKPARPSTSVRMVSSDMTNAIFVQRIIDNDRNGHKRMFGKYNEIELLDGIAKGSSAGRKEVGKIMRLAFDNDLYGQERYGAQAVSGKAPIRFNWVASSTIQNVKDYFARMISDGTLNRIAFSYIQPQERGNTPVAGIYEEEYAAQLRPYLDNLQMQLTPTHTFQEVIKKQFVGEDRIGRRVYQYRIADTTKPYIIRLPDGRIEVFCPEAYKLAMQLNQENTDIYDISADDIYDSFTYRANIIAYKKAMILYIANGCKWEPCFDEFIRWSERYDLWIKMQLFADDASRKLAGETFEGKAKGPENLLQQLPKTFTRNELIAARLSKGMTAKPRFQLYNWIRRGFIQQNEDGTYTIINNADTHQLLL